MLVGSKTRTPPPSTNGCTWANWGSFTTAAPVIMHVGLHARGGESGCVDLRVPRVTLVGLRCEPTVQAMAITNQESAGLRGLVLNAIVVAVLGEESGALHADSERPSCATALTDSRSSKTPTVTAALVITFRFKFIYVLLLSIRFRLRVFRVFRAHLSQKQLPCQK